MRCRLEEYPEEYKEEIKKIEKEAAKLMGELKEELTEDKVKLVYSLEELNSMERNLFEEIAFKDGLKVGMLIARIICETD